jgi:hypothetical protein
MKKQSFVVMVLMLLLFVNDAIANFNKHVFEKNNYAI